MSPPIPPDPSPSSRKLRIVHYAPGLRLELGGVVRAVLDWCTILSARGHEIILVTHDSPDAPADWDGKGGRPLVVQVPTQFRPNGFVPKTSVRMWEEYLSPGSVVHLHCPWTASNMQMSRAARRRGVPYIVSIHGMLDDWAMAQRTWKKRLFLSLGGRLYMSRAARLHYSAQAEREQAEKWVPKSRAVVLPLIVDLKPFANLPGPEIARTKFQLDASVPVVLFLSRIHEKKGLNILIDAAELLRKTATKFNIVIAGEAAPADREYERSLHAQVERLGLKDCVHFVGMVRGAEKISLYQAADLFVLPTLQENLGIVLIEAMAAGTAVLTTRGTDVWREIQAAAGTISDNSPAPLAEAMGRLLNDRAALADSANRGRAWVMETFNEDKLARDYEAMYAQVIDGD